MPTRFDNPRNYICTIDISTAVSLSGRFILHVLLIISPLLYRLKLGDLSPFIFTLLYALQIVPLFKSQPCGLYNLAFNFASLTAHLASSAVVCKATIEFNQPRKPNMYSPISPKEVT